MRPHATLQLARVALRIGDTDAAMAAIDNYLAESGGAPRSATAGAILGDVAASLERPDLWESCYTLLEPWPFPLVAAHYPVSVQRVMDRLAGRRRLWSRGVEHFEGAGQQLADRGAPR